MKLKLQVCTTKVPECSDKFSILSTIKRGSVVWQPRGILLLFQYSENTCVFLGKTGIYLLQPLGSLHYGSA